MVPSRESKEEKRIRAAQEAQEKMRRKEEERERGERQDHAKVQEEGASKRLEQAVAAPSIALAKILRTEWVSPKSVVVPDAFKRHPSEYESKEFNELLEDIKATGGNVTPIDVRERIVDGYMQLELMSGTRRRECTIRAGLQLRVNVREADDALADKLHDIENAKRAEKSYFSLAMQLQAMNDSGRYATQAELAAVLGRSEGGVSDAIRVIKTAPSGFWAAIKNPTDLTRRDGLKLIKAFQKPAFVTYTKSLSADSTPLKTALARATECLARPKKEANDASIAHSIILKQRGKFHHIVIPESVEQSIRLEALELIKKLVAEKCK